MDWISPHPQLLHHLLTVSRPCDHGASKRVFKVNEIIHGDHNLIGQVSLKSHRRIQQRGSCLYTGKNWELNLMAP